MADKFSKLSSIVNLNPNLELDLSRGVPLDVMNRKALQETAEDLGQKALEYGVVPAVKVVDYLGGATRTGISAPFRTDYSTDELKKFITGQEMWPSGDELTDKIQEKHPDLVNQPGLSAAIATGLEFSDPLNFVPGAAPAKEGAEMLAKKAAMQAIRDKQAKQLLTKFGVGAL